MSGVVRLIRSRPSSASPQRDCYTYLETFRGVTSGPRTALRCAICISIGRGQAPQLPDRLRPAALAILFRLDPNPTGQLPSHSHDECLALNVPNLCPRGALLREASTSGSVRTLHPVPCLLPFDPIAKDVVASLRGNYLWDVHFLLYRDVAFVEGPIMSLNSGAVFDVACAAARVRAFKTGLGLSRR